VSNTPAPIEHCAACPWHSPDPGCCWHPTARPLRRYVAPSYRCHRTSESLRARWAQEQAEAALPAARFFAGESVGAIAADLGLSVAEVEGAIRERLRVGRGRG